MEEILAWIPLVAAGLSAAASIGGGLMSSAGQASANAANVAMQNQANTTNANIAMAQHAQNTGFMEDQQAFNAEQQSAQNVFNAAEAEKARAFASVEARAARDTQMNFQTAMSNTQYQRAMADMKAAGLNPMLAYQQGGAGTPSGGPQQASASQASGSAASSGMASSSASGNQHAAQVLNDKDTIGRAIGNVVSSSLETMKTFQEIDYIGKQAELATQNTAESRSREEFNKANTGKVVADTGRSQAETARTGEETVRTQHETKRTAQETINAGIQAGILAAQSSSARSQAEIDKRRASDTYRYGSQQTPPIWERISRTIQDAMEWWGRGGPLTKGNSSQGNPGLVIDMKK